MAVRTQCPRCNQPLSVPNKLAGSYASCPRCQGRFWVSRDAPLDSSVSDSGATPLSGGLTLTQVPVATPPLPAASGRATQAPASPASGPTVPVSPVGAAGAPPVPPRQYFPSVTPLAPAAEVPAARAPVDGAPAAPPQARKVARLVSAEAAQSSLKLAADGQLPQLQLQEIDKKDVGQGKSRSIPPLVMILAWIFSVASTIAIVWISNNNERSSVTTAAKQEALAAIEKDFFGNPARGELLPYQRLLREAVQARARKDLKGERHYYKQVLDLLHTETWDGSSARTAQNRLEKGITGSRDHDRELEQLILKVLGD